jgi:hypothetical protein
MNIEIIQEALHKNKLEGIVTFSIVQAKNIYSPETIEVTVHNKTLQLIAEYKTEPRLMHLPYLNAVNQDMGPIFLIAEYISNPVKEQLRAAKINYLDAAGNIYINCDPIFIYIEGQKRQPAQAEKNNRVFTKAGLRIVFGFLHHPELINLPYRLISEKTGCALDSVHKVIHGLKNLGYVQVVTEKKMELVNKRALLIR